MAQSSSLILLLQGAFPLFVLSNTAQLDKPFSNSYFFRHFDMKLRCGIFKTLLAVNYMECHEKCAAKMSCFSVNFYQENKTDVCELIKGSRSSFGEECSVRKAGSKHIVLENSDICSASSLPCKAGQIRKALPGNWYQLGSSAFKFFEEKKNHTEASAVCSANDGALATITSEKENNFVAELYLKEHSPKLRGQAPLLIQDTLKPFKHWKLDGSDSDVTLVGNLAAEKDENNISAALHFTGIASAYATTPLWNIDTMTFSISIWFKLDAIFSQSPFIYSHWYSPYVFSLNLQPQSPNFRLFFVGRKKNDPSSDLFAINGQVVVNQWVHVVGVWNRATKQATLYQDGLQVAQSVPLTTSELDLPLPSRTVFDLGYKRDSGTVMKGWLRELLIFDRAVTSEEVNIIKDATQMYPRVWIGPPQGYRNMAPVTRPSTNCLSVRAWAPYQWEEAQCDQKMDFICKKPV